ILPTDLHLKTNLNYFKIIFLFVLFTIFKICFKMLFLFPLFTVQFYSPLGVDKCLVRLYFTDNCIMSCVGLKLTERIMFASHLRKHHQRMILLVLLLMSPILSRLGHGFNWRWALIMVWSEMKGTPNIHMAVLLAYSDLSLGSEWEKSQILFHGVSVCLITLIVNRFVLPMAVTELGLHDVMTKYKYIMYKYYRFQHFQELTKSIAMALKFDKGLANADWNMVEKAIELQNPYTLNKEETTEHQKWKCPDCNKEIDETLDIEAMELANRHLLSAQIASYQRQYRDEILTQSTLQVLVGAAGSSGEKGEYMSPETLKTYSESKKFLSFIRELLLDWAYNTKKDKVVPSKYSFLHACHKIVFSDEFEYTGYLVVLMNTYPMVICWVSQLNDIYEYEIRYANYYFLTFYILEALLKMVVMRKKFISYHWLLFELGITLIGILDVIVIETDTISYDGLTEIVIFMNLVRLLRVLRILKLITPKLLQIIDKKMTHEISFQYAILKGYVQGEMDVLNIIDQIASSKQAKQILLKRVTKNMERAMKELGYLEYNYPEIAVTMKTKEEINVMLNMAREIVKTFRSKGIIHKVEGAEINKLIMAKKKEVLDFQSTIQPLDAEEALFNIPWLGKDNNCIHFIQEGSNFVTFDCENNIFEEGDEPQGIYIIISGMVKLKRTKPQLENAQVPLESEGKAYSIIYTEYLLSGEIIGELNCLTKQPVQYSATCKSSVEAYFIPIDHLYEGFEKRFPVLKHKMWQKIGLAIAAQKLREHISFEDWNYKMQLKLCNAFIKDIPKATKTDIYDETITHVILIHGSAEDCQLRKIYKAPFLIPVTCHRIQGTEDFTKVMIIQTSAGVRKFRWNVKKFIASSKVSMTPQLKDSIETLDESLNDEARSKDEMNLPPLHFNKMLLLFGVKSWLFLGLLSSPSPPLQPPDCGSPLQDENPSKICHNIKLLLVLVPRMEQQSCHCHGPSPRSSALRQFHTSPTP
ncbi:sodium/hydrogen exchanger 10-like, partial [Nannospalax galili]|uniref:sodium/hydrogen exchanger 10-like n=1 Tax=Nannospalax galili TaxID=1026970 RepID=UPI0004ED3958